MRPAKTRDPFVNAWPRLTRFYGLTPAQLQVFPRWLMALYIDAIPSLAAEEQLLGMQVSGYPHMSEADGKELHRELLRKVDDLPEPEAAPMIDPTTDGRSILEGMGIQVVTESA